MGEGDWTNVIIAGDTSNLGFTHLRSYLVAGRILAYLELYRLGIEL